MFLTRSVTVATVPTRQELRPAIHSAFPKGTFMAIKAVLFDIDGTLVDSNDFHIMA
ncbi:hypothetical protein FHS94_003732 [Sphingomonas aerophila]|uniref:Uncharacterized protein n=1 Tax=Sphingomonas aerophila TaxID=1344948 RepID=A0A7W9BGL4_9SPHN|nr:hypothetical protein [Sphingomonas aerophila]